MRPHRRRRFPGVHRLLPLLLIGLAPAAALADLPAAGGPPSAWGPRSRERMLADALKVSPPVLASLIRKHPDSLRAGLAEATLTEGTAQHRQGSEEPSSGAAAAMEIVAGKAVAALDGHRPMADVVFYLGVLSHLAADVSDPLLTAPPGADPHFAGDFPDYVERNLDRFPAVFYGYVESPEDLKESALLSAKLTREYFAHLARAYEAAGGSSATFDVRSIPFGVASLCYSRAVTGIARAWLHVWREAHGDLAGTPYLKATGIAAGTGTGGPPAAAPPGEASISFPAETDEERTEGAGDPNGAPITKTIIGKSRKRLSAAAHPDPNAQARSSAGPGPNGPADPNGKE